VGFVAFDLFVSLVLKILRLFIKIRNRLCSLRRIVPLIVLQEVRDILKYLHNLFIKL
jgi:hypothetical protein